MDKEDNKEIQVKKQRGRPRKNKVSPKDIVKILEPDLADRYIKSVKAKQKRLNAVYIDTVYAMDTKEGTKVEMNIYRVQKKKSSNRYDIDDECIYVGFGADFIESLDTDIIPTPLGSADLIENDDDEDSDEYSEDYYNF